MAMLSKACKLDNFESRNSLKLSFTNVQGLCSFFSKGLDSHVSLFCFFSISGMAPLITCFDVQLKNILKKFITLFMYFNCSVFQILLQIFILFNFLSVIRTLITVNVLIVS